MFLTMYARSVRSYFSLATSWMNMTNCLALVGSLAISSAKMAACPSTGRCLEVQLRRSLAWSKVPSSSMCFKTSRLALHALFVFPPSCCLTFSALLYRTGQRCTCWKISRCTESKRTQYLTTLHPEHTRKSAPSPLDLKQCWHCICDNRICWLMSAPSQGKMLECSSNVFLSGRLGHLYYNAD